MAGLVAHRTDLAVQEILGVGQVLPEKRKHHKGTYCIVRWWCIVIILYYI